MSKAVKCPKCKCDTLHTQPEPTLQFDRCEKCKGTWLDGGELAQFSNLKNDLPNSDSIVSDEKVTSFNCPRCEQSGKTHPLYEIPYTAEDSSSQAELFVDYCKSCRGIWLDAKELGGVQDILKKMRIKQKLQRINK